MGLDRRQFILTGAAAAAAAGITAESVDPALATPAAEPGAVRVRSSLRGTWLPGETHCHDDHSSDGSEPRQESNQTLPGNLPVADQIGQAERVGLDFLPLTDHRTYDQQWDPGWTSSQLLLVPGEEADGSPHAIVLGAIDVIVDGANPAGSASFRHLQQSIWDAHAQNASWHVAHPDDGELNDDGTPNDNASAQGMHNIEVLNVASDPEAEVTYAEDRWNHGFRTGVTAASDNHFRELWDIDSPGQPTTWVFAADRSVRAILDALRAGHTTVSQDITGPFLTLTADLDGDGVDEVMGGDEVVVRSRRLHPRATISVRAQRASGIRLVVYAAPGRSAGPVLDTTIGSDDETHVIVPKLTSDHGWYRAEIRSPGGVSGIGADPNLPDQLRATVSPLFISVGSPAVPMPEIALPAVTTGRDGSVPVVGERDGFAGFGDIAATGELTHVVSQVNAAGRTTVVYQQLIGDRAVGRPQLLSEGSGTASLPKVAAAGRDVWVVWQDELGAEQPHHPNILLRHSADGGLRFGPPQQLTHTTGRSIQPDITLVGRRPVVAWADNSATGAFDVYVQIVGVDAAPVNVSTTGKTVDPGDPAADARSPRFPASLWPSLAADDRGRVLVTWQDDRFDPDPLWTGHTPPPGQPASGGTDPDNWQILAASRTGRSWSAPAQVSKSTTTSDRHPSVTSARDGFVIAWDSGALASSGVNLSVRSATSSDGTTWTDSVPVAVDADAMSQRPRLSVDRGEVRAVWYDSRADDWRWKVFTATLDPKSVWSDGVQVTLPGNSTYPAVDGGLVVFTSDRNAIGGQRDGTQQVFVSRL